VGLFSLLFVGSWGEQMDLEFFCAFFRITQIWSDQSHLKVFRQYIHFRTELIPLPGKRRRGQQHWRGTLAKTVSRNNTGKNT
jgi:hypothetical protein